MAETDWTEMSDGLSAPVVDRGVTAGVTVPPSTISNSFVFGFHSLAAAEGAVAYHTNQANFSPMVKGGRIVAAVKRAVSAAPLGWSPFLFLGAQGTSVNDGAYLLGLEDADPYRIVLRKAGTIQGGIPLADETNSLRRSSEQFSVVDDAWHHLRLDMVVNDNGDVVLNVFSNDLDVNGIGDTPDWQAIQGMSQFIDDALGINSGSQPHISGYGGFGTRVEEITRRAYFDHVEVERQL